MSGSNKMKERNEPTVSPHGSLLCCMLSLLLALALAIALCLFFFLLYCSIAAVESSREFNSEQCQPVIAHESSKSNYAKIAVETKHVNTVGHSGMTPSLLPSFFFFFLRLPRKIVDTFFFSFSLCPPFPGGFCFNIWINRS